MVGKNLSHYKVLEELGRGGMGIVYRATDTKLNRDVALKILPAAALASDDDRARFFREAQAAAQLHHPNIATVFEIDEAILKDAAGNEINATDGPRPYIAMELIEGETLQEVIKKAPMSLADAVKVASQVSEALKAAHAKEIVHRDIKSANVMMTVDGIAKVLDFGLAKTNQSTMLTRMGSTLGTVAYMSPEQAKGQEVDGRSDLYSLGTMMYEMIAGRLPYDGEYEQAVVYSILNEPPEPLTSLRTGVPMQLEWIVDKLLAKEADYRYQSAAGLLADLKTLDLSGSGHSRRSMTAATSPVATAAPEPTMTAKTMSKNTWGVIGGVLFVGLIAGWLLKPSPEISEEPIRKFRLPIPEMTWVSDPLGSPDGRYWAFTGRDSSGTRAAYLWDASTFSFQKIVNSDGHGVLSFSPDGNWMALRGGGGISRARVPSGSVIEVDTMDEAIWADSERLITMEDDFGFSFWEVAPETGEHTQIHVTGLDSTYTDFDYLQRVDGFPIMLVTADRADYSEVLAINYETGESQVLVRAACCARYHDSGTLLYLTALEGFWGKLVAQRFEPSSLLFTGSPIDLTSDPIQKVAFGTGGDDSFLMNPMTSQANQTSGLNVSRLDPESGSSEEVNLPSAWYDRLSFSPDGTEIAIERAESGELAAESNIFVIDMETGTERRFTYTIGTNRVPVWTPSQKIYFVGGNFDDPDIYVKNADGTGGEQLIVENADYPSVSDDEQWLLYSRRENKGDLYALNLASGQEVAIDTSATLRAGDPSVSPDGRYIAYTTSPENNNLVGALQRLFIRSFPDPSQFFIQVVEGRADDPFWSEDGKTLFYRDRGQIFRMGVSTEDGFSLTSSPETVARFPGQVIRTDLEPGTGQIFVVHQGRSIGGGREGSDLEITLSFTKYLDKLFGDRE